MKNPQKNKVSIQAFIQQVQNWQLTLLRQQKKLKQFRPHIKQKILLNQLNILIISIDNQLIKYKKFKDVNKIQYLDIIQQYNENSKKFIDIMQAIGNFCEKIQNIMQNNTCITLQIDQQQNQYRQLSQKQKYQKQTFNYSVSKKSKHNKIDSFSHGLPSKIIAKKLSSVLNTQSRIITNKTMENSLNIANIPKKSKNMSMKATPNLSMSKIKKNTQQLDSWQIKYQLKQIKSMITQIHNQIKYHNHQDIEQQLSKIQRNNKKITLQLKTLKQDNQFIMTRIKKLSNYYSIIEQQLYTQKQIQTQMIQEFENTNKNQYKSKKNQNHNTNNNQHSGEQIHDYVVFQSGLK